MGLVTFYDLSEACKTGAEVDPSGWALATTVDPHETATGNISLPLWYYPHLSSTIYDPGVESKLIWQEKKQNDKNTS